MYALLGFILAGDSKRRHIVRNTRLRVWGAQGIVTSARRASGNKGVLNEFKWNHRLGGIWELNIFARRAVWPLKMGVKTPSYVEKEKKLKKGKKAVAERGEQAWKYCCCISTGKEKERWKSSVITTLRLCCSTHLTLCQVQPHLEYCVSFWSLQ